MIAAFPAVSNRASSRLSSVIIVLLSYSRERTKRDPIPGLRGPYGSVETNEEGKEHIIFKRFIHAKAPSTR